MAKVKTIMALHWAGFEFFHLEIDSTDLDIVRKIWGIEGETNGTIYPF